MSYACPKCKSDRLEVIVSASATLVQEDGTASAVDFRDHDWDEQSPMECYDCKFEGVAAQFEQPEE